MNKGKKWNVFHVNFVLFERLNIKQCLADIKKNSNYAKQKFIRYHCQTNCLCASWFFITTLTKLYF